MRVAPLSVTIEQATSPSTARSSSGSSRRRHSLGTSAGGGSEAGWIGVVAALTLRSEGIRCGRGSSGRARSLHELAAADPEPLLEDEPRGGRGGLGAEAALLHRHDDDDRT